jgi:DNA-binding transcriptional LysR family regulator
MLAHMLQSADIEWHIAMEASCWDLMLQFVRLGLGLAVVNACCHLPRGVLSRPMPELPLLQYYLLHLDKTQPQAARELRESLLECADAWEAPNRR